MNLNWSLKGKTRGDRKTELGAFLQYQKMEKERARVPAVKEKRTWPSS